jgi:hypothetical protein
LTGNSIGTRISSMTQESTEEIRFRPALGLVGALLGLVGGRLLGSGWFDAVTPTAVGFLLGGAAMLLQRIWLHLLVIFGVLAGCTWLLIHFFLS